MRSVLLICLFLSSPFFCLKIKGDSCPDGWFQSHKSCYKLQINEITFLEAVNECIQDGGYLLHPETTIEYKTLLYTFSSAYDTSFWITSEESDNNVTCHYVEKTTEKSGSCHETRSFICTSHKVVETNCGNLISYRRFMDKCYLLGPPSTGLNGKKYCRDANAELVDVWNVLLFFHATAVSVIEKTPLWMRTADNSGLCKQLSMKGEFLRSSCESTASPFCEKSIDNYTLTSSVSTSSVSTSSVSTSSVSTSSVSTSSTPTTLSTTSVLTTFSTTLVPATFSTPSTLTTFSTEKSSVCPLGHGWKANVYNEHACYVVSSYIWERMNWDEAKNFCRSYGGDLASYADSVEESFALGSDRGEDSLWIGLRRNQSLNGSLEWSDGSTLVYTNWAKNEPKNQSNKNCAFHNGPQSKWEMSPCGIMRWFVCKWPQGRYPLKPEKTPSVEPRMCEGGGHWLSWYAFEDHCYAIYFTSDDSWHTANFFCSDNDGYLASIHSPEENNFILSIIRGTSLENLWIGLSSRGLHSSFTWNDGSLLDFVNWDEDQRNDSILLNKCVAFDKYSGFWILQHCNTFLSVICKKRANGTIVTSTPTPELELPGFCPDEWYTLDNYCYKSFGFKSTEKLSWAGANVKCREVGAQLASIHSEKEQDFLTNLVMDVGYGTWIGLNAEKRGVLYHWTDNSSLDFTQWKEGEPYFEDRLENCVEMVYDEIVMGKWNDVVCGKPKSFICKKAKDPALLRPGSDPTRCADPKGWVRLGYSCFSEIYEEASPWLEAQSKCQKLRSNLPTVQNFATTLFFKNLLANEHWVWLGAREQDMIENNKYAWLTQYRMLYSNWLNEQPKRVSDHNNCVAINAEGYWAVRDCQEKLNFFCEINSVDYFRPQVYKPSVCPNSSIRWLDLHVGSNCYHISEEYQSFYEAMKTCFLKGGSLASFHSTEELEAIAPFLKSVGVPVYIGLAQKHDGSFGWIDGSAVDFVHWEEGEPNSDEELCVEIDSEVLTWNDIMCEELKMFICSTPKIIIEPNVAASKTNKTIHNKRVQDRLTVGGIVSIIICLIVIIIIISLASYYLCPRTKNRTKIRMKRMSDQEFL